MKVTKSAASAAAALLGRLGGLSTSPAKVAASRANGRKGGRPCKDSNARSASKLSARKRPSKQEK